MAHQYIMVGGIRFFTQFLPSFTEFFLVLTSFTEFFLALPSFT